MVSLHLEKNPNNLFYSFGITWSDEDIKGKKVEKQLANYGRTVADEGESIYSIDLINLDQDFKLYYFRRTTLAFQSV